MARASLAALSDLEGLQGDGSSWRFQSAHVTRALGGLVGVLEHAQIDIIELHVQKATLEDVFLELTANK